MNRLGILGGGQLGMYLAMAAKAHGVEVIALDPQAHCSIQPYCDTFLQYDYNDAFGLEQLFAQSDRVLFEFENVDLALLQAMQAKYPDKVVGNLNALATSQDRLLEKQAFVAANLPVVPFEKWTKEYEYTHPCIIKTARFGYDGKGQYRIQSVQDYERFLQDKGEQDYVVEDWLDFEQECSIIAIRSKTQWIFYPLMENVHKQGILQTTRFPASFSSDYQEQAQHLIQTLMETHDYYGILCLELFVFKGGLLLNEMAPRPHNSGHVTMQTCRHSIYDNAVRCALHKPMQPCGLVQEGVMLNVLGQHYEKIDYRLNTYYDYGKQVAKYNRKMGHFVFVAKKASEAMLQAKQYIKEMGEHDE
ncbi:MAG: ATP-grasp domain-containing protein [Erysipelotrichaceae bacterium]